MHYTLSKTHHTACKTPKMWSLQFTCRTNAILKWIHHNQTDNKYRNHHVNQPSCDMFVQSDYLLCNATDRLQSNHPEDPRISTCVIFTMWATVRRCWMPWEASSLKACSQALPCSAPLARSCTATRWQSVHAAHTSGSCSLLKWGRGPVASSGMYERVREREMKRVIMVGLCL